MQQDRTGSGMIYQPDLPSLPCPRFGKPRRSAKRPPQMIDRDVPVAPIIGILVGGGLFFGIPLWLGYADQSFVWIALWCLVFAPMSPGGVDLIDGLIQPQRGTRPVAGKVARCASIVVQIGAIGMACYGLGRAVG
jgi:hypothetical protein